MSASGSSETTLKRIGLGGAVSLPEEEHLGAIEEEVRHIIARRMKRQGVRWAIPCGDCMARILGAGADGRLETMLVGHAISSRKCSKRQ